MQYIIKQTEKERSEFEWKSARLHKELVATIENYVETDPEMGYRSLSDFTTDALTRKLFLRE
jgi:hypothetical protein